MDSDPKTNFDEFEFDDAIQPAFNQITKPELLPIDEKLPAITLLGIDREENYFNIKFAIPKIPKRCSAYLFINKKKKDMFFQIAPGLFNFRCVNIEASDEAEIFYAVGLRRSNSIFFNLKV